MIDAYVLNLDSRPDRWASLKKKFQGSESLFKLHRVSAVVKDVGAHGNFLSCIKAIKLAKKRGLAEVLILEDDCLPVKGFREKWTVIKNWLDSNPDKWDIYSGGAHQILLPESIGEAKGFKFYDPMWSVASHWIYIQERSYDKLLKHYNRFSIGANYWSKLGVNVHNNLFKTVISHPFIAYQDSGFSDINKRKRSTRKLFRNAERGLSRKN